MDADGQTTAVVGSLRDITRQIRNEQAIREAYRKVMTISERERRRVAKELHDSVGQGLVALKMAIQAATSTCEDICESSRQSLNQATEHCGQLVREVRSICHGLYPPTLESLGLVGVLDQLRSSIDAAGLSPELHIDESLQNGRFSNDVEIALFRIAQEATSNVLRHAQADSIRILLRWRGDYLILWVADDGKGFDTTGDIEGLGIRTMRERIEALDGSLRITSRPGRTIVRARLKASPVDKNASSR
jgi:two-component system NarL family sensor kinase